MARHSSECYQRRRVGAETNQPTEGAEVRGSALYYNNQHNNIMADNKTKDLVKQMVDKYWQWCTDFYGEQPQHGSQQSYVVEYNTMKGIKNMLQGSYKSKTGNIPDDGVILGMWERLLGYLREKNNYNGAKLLYIHRNYNVITAQMIRHKQKEKEAQVKSKKAQTQQTDMLQRASIIQQMMGGCNG